MVRKRILRGLGLLALLCSAAYGQDDLNDANLSVNSQNSVRSGNVEVNSNAEANPNNEGLESEDRSARAHAETMAKAMASGGNAAASANANANANVNLYPPQPAVCQYEEQVIYQQNNKDCYICVCVLRRMTQQLEPICGSCSACQVQPTEPPLWPTVPPIWSTTETPVWPTTPAWPTPPPIRPTSTPTPVWPPSTIQPPPPPPPEHPSCDPLPTNQHFQNPLDPCQICICRQTVDVFGAPSMPNIECIRNPECVHPSTPAPPKPPGPPEPLPICKHYPPNIWFPHPIYNCEICQCSLEPSIYGPPKPAITCHPDPNCGLPSTIAPPPMPTTASPAPLPPQPPHVLPGPSPHESCYPYPPNEVFQHPWDTCQACVCSEAHSLGLVSVEVNCYTKPECCLELMPIPSPQPIQPDQRITYTEPKCQSRQPNQPFEYEGHVCVCQIMYQYITATCTPVITNPNGNRYPITPGSSAEATAIANAVASGGMSHADASANANVNGGFNPSQYPGLPGNFGPMSNQGSALAETIANAVSNAYGPGSQAHSTADAEAIANSGSNTNTWIQYPGSQYPLAPYHVPQNPGLQYPVQSGPNQSSASAEAIANAISGGDQSQSSASADAAANGNGNSNPWGQYPGYQNPLAPYPVPQNPGLQYPVQSGSSQSSTAAEAIANAMFGGDQSQSSASADAAANGNGYSNPWGQYPGSQYPGSQYPVAPYPVPQNPGLQYPVQSGPSQSSASAEAITNAISGGGQSQSSASADAVANGGGNSNPWGQNPLAPYPVPQNPGLQYLVQSGLSQSSASAEAIANAMSGGSQIQSSAQADATANGGGNVNPWGQYPVPAQRQEAPGNGYSLYNQAPGMTPTQAQANAAAQAQNPIINLFARPASYSGGADSLSEAQANAFAQGGISQAQAQAYASMEKSGEPNETESAAAA